MTSAAPQLARVTGQLLRRGGAVREPLHALRLEVAM
jgi:hypothetical protein